MFRDKISLAGWVVIGLALVSLMQVLWVSYETRQHSICQNRLNSELVSITKARASIADQDRDAIRNLVVTVFTAGAPDPETGKTPTPEQQQKKVLNAYEDYNNTNKHLDELREGLAFPDENACE